jgi:DNA gyrase/topoisomerase IV subunit A
MRTGRGPIGVIGIDDDKTGPLLTPDQRRLLDALVDQGALAIERVLLVEDMDRVKRTVESDRLRSALLTSISHDLKTPLASVLGAASTIRDLAGGLTDAEKRDLLATVIDESERLNRFIANLLDMTKLEAGAIKPNAALHDLGEIVGTALERTSKILAQHRVEIDLAEAMIEKEPVTVVLSEKGWLRAIRGHQTELDSLAFKEGDRLKRAVKAQTTDTLLLFGTNGRFYALGADKLPGGRGHGEPFRLMIDIEEAADAVELFVHEPGRKLLVAGTSGHGFVVAEDEVVAMTRKGKQVLNVEAGTEAIVCAAVDGDSVAVIGDNRKLLLFPLKELPEMLRGKGVRLQRYKDGGLADATVFKKKEGLIYIDAAGRSFTVTELRDWWGVRAQAGRLPPKGFPKSNSFGAKF